MKRVLLFAATTGYQVGVFAAEARRIGFDLTLATDRCHVLDDPWGDRAVSVQFENPENTIGSLSARGPFDGVLALGDTPAMVAARVADRLGLRFSPASSVETTRDKYLSRKRFHDAGLPTPPFRKVRLAADPEQEALESRYPCVLKPLSLSASRGVIRANTPLEFMQAFARIKRMLEGETHLLVENFIRGREFALEGLVSGGRLQVLALFDKPDPLDGPFFEETIYVTPSRAPDAVAGAIFETTQRAVKALGLTDCPVHAEMRLQGTTVWMLEVAARPIGGLCGKVLQFGGATLEETLLRHAVGEDVSQTKLSPGAHGVMMIPIPHGGVYLGVEGLEPACAVAGIEDIVISAKEGQHMLPLPEGASYLGFIFARGENPDFVEQALRKAHSCLHFHLLPSLPVVRCKQ